MGFIKHADADGPAKVLTPKEQARIRARLKLLGKTSAAKLNPKEREDVLPRDN